MKTQKIVLGIDGSEGAGHATRWVAKLAADIDAEVVAVHAIEMPVTRGDVYASTAWFDEHWRDDITRTVEEDWCQPFRDGGIKYRAELVEGSPTKMLHELARRESADMIVVGKRGLGGFREFLLGSVSHELVHHSDVPVVVVPPERRTTKKEAS